MRRRRWLLVILGFLAAGTLALSLWPWVMEAWHIRRLSSEDETTRRAAAEALGAMRSTRAVPRLLEIIPRDHHVPLEHHAFQAIVACGPDAVPGLIEEYRNGSIEHRFHVEWALGVIGRFGPSGEDPRMVLEEAAARGDSSGLGLQLLRTGTGARLRGRSADLRRSNFRDADLAGVDLSGCDLRGSRLEGADLTDANLRGAVLSQDLGGWSQIASIRLANIHGVKDPPPGFLEWARAQGAIEAATDEEWKRMVLERFPPPSAPAPSAAAFRSDPLAFGFRALGPISAGLDAYEHQATGIAMVLLPGGDFLMGRGEGEMGDEPDNQPRHTVRLSPFLLARHEVSQRVWRTVMGWNPSEKQDDDFSVESVSWEDCWDFCRKTGLRLPSEAQWEYACSAGDRSGEPDGAGLFGMKGRVAEWCEDLYSRSFYSDPAALGPDPVCGDGDFRSRYRVIRGGGEGPVARGTRNRAHFATRSSSTGLRPSFPLSP